jgi:hypothetical protein
MTNEVKVEWKNAVTLLGALDPDDARLVELLSKNKNQADVARELGWTRSKVWHRKQALTKRIRAAK